MYHLGVDIGTSANAMYALELDKEGYPQKHIFHELMIFGEPVEGKNSTLKSVNRRIARGQRRRLNRKVNRLKKIWHLASLCGIDQEISRKFYHSLGEKNDAFSMQGYERLWELRAKAVRERVPLEAIFAIAGLMAKHRGYSAAEPKSFESIKGKIADCKPLAKSDYQATGFGLVVTDAWKLQEPLLTPGQILLKKRLSGEIESFINNENKQSDKKDVVLDNAAAISEQNGKFSRKTVNPSIYSFKRLDYQRELTAILETQSQFYPVLKQSIEEVFASCKNAKYCPEYFWNRRPKTFADSLVLAVFYQYPRKSFEHLIGPCSLDPWINGKKNKRIVSCHPAAERFRALKTAMDMKWKKGRDELPLTSAQVELFVAMSTAPWEFGIKVSDQGKADMLEFYNALEDRGIPKPVGMVANLDNVRSRKMVCSAVNIALKKAGVLEQYDNLSADKKGAFFEIWTDIIDSSDSWGFDEQRETILQRDDLKLNGTDLESVLSLFDIMMEKEGAIKSVKELGLSGNRMSYGESTCNVLSEYMLANSVDEYTAREALFPCEKKSIDLSKLTRKSEFNRVIPKVVAPGSTYDRNADVIEITNPTVRRSLQELRKAMIRKFSKHGVPSSVTLEMSREAKSSKKDRDRISKKQRSNEALRDAAAAALRDANKDATKANIRKVLLLWEQGSMCPYTGQTITVSQAVDGQSVHEDHIIPRALVKNSNSRSAIILTTAQSNFEKSNCEIVFQWFKERNQISEFGEMKKRLAHLEKNFVTKHQDGDFPQLKEAFKAKVQKITRESAFEFNEDVDDFAERQYSDTSYIARQALRMFSAVCRDVVASRGQLTALIRGNKLLQANSIIVDDLLQRGIVPDLGQLKPTNQEIKEIKEIRKRAADLEAKGHEGSAKVLREKADIMEREPLGLFYERKRDNDDGRLIRVFDKRCDHRQHLVDACVVALSTRKLMHGILNEERESFARHRRMDFERLKARFIKPGIKEGLERVVRQFVVVQKPDRMGVSSMLKAGPISSSLGAQAPQGKYFIKTSRDRRGGQHQKFIPYDGFVAARLSPNRSRCEPLRFDQFIKEKKDGTLVVGDEFLIYKGDVFKHEGTRGVYRLGMIKESSGGLLMCVPPSLSLTYNELVESGPKGGVGSIAFSLNALNKAFGQIKLIKNRFSIKHGS